MPDVDLYANRRLFGVVTLVVSAAVLVLGIFLWIHSTSAANDKELTKGLTAAMGGRDPDQVHVDPNRTPALVAWGIGSIGLLAGVIVYVSTPPRPIDRQSLEQPENATDGWS